MPKNLQGVGGSPYQDMLEQVLDRISPGTTALTAPFHYTESPVAVHHVIRRVNFDGANSQINAMSDVDVVGGGAIAGP